MSPLPDWEDPATWAVGDNINAALWTSRVYNPVSLLLRRPLMVARRTTSLTVPSGGSVVDLACDTIDADDDGMVTTDLPAAKFYAQRSGSFNIFAAVPWTANGSSGRSYRLSCYINSVQTLLRQTNSCRTSSGADSFRGLSGGVNLIEGDEIWFNVSNFTAASSTIPAQFNAPRIVIFWSRPTV